jgi:ABC-type branched-subunit amino acid transport system substrate-binding protein
MERSSPARRFVAAIAVAVMGWSMLGVLPTASASTLPAVSSVSPTSGSTHGGTRVTVIGARFTHVTAVLFGSTKGTSIRVVSSTKLLVTAPSHRAGVLNVLVQTGAGTSPATTRDRFRYIPATSCVFFRNGPGITSSTITIGNASDISGPVPGLFQASQDAVKAYVAYFNATSSICGRKIRLASQDSQTTSSGDQVAYQSLCKTSFAAVGSMSAFDSGGASTAQSCGLPDIRTASTTSARNACRTCFAADGSNSSYYENAPFEYFFQQNPSLKQHVAVAYMNAGGAAQIAGTIHGVLTKLGATNVDMQPIGVSDLSYDSFVQAMKTHSDQYVIFLGAYQNTVKLQQAMQTDSFTPAVFVQDPTIYDPAYVQQANTAGVGNGTYVYLNFLPFSQASSNREESNYLSWLHRVSAGSNPTAYGAFAWSAAALFAHEASYLGGELSRANLVHALSGVHSWTANGMTAAQNVGGKINGSCWQFIQLENGNWNSAAGYQCDGVTLG